MGFIRMRESKGEDIFVNRDFIVSVKPSDTRGQFLVTLCTNNGEAVEVRTCEILTQAGRAVAQTEMLHRALRGEI